MPDINLIPSEARTAERYDVIRKKLLLVSVISLVLVAVVTIATLVLFTQLSSQRSELIEQVESASQTIESLKENEELVVVVKQKASVADKILSSRIGISQILAKFSELIPQGVYFTDFRINADKIVISGKAKTSADMANFVSSLTSDSGSQIVLAVTVDSLSSDESGVYSFVMSATINQTQVQ